MINYFSIKFLLSGLIVFIFILLFSYKLDVIPPNISGDETSYLNAAYQTLFSPEFINPFLLMEDHTKTASNFYWMGTWIRIFGLNYSIFAMRFSVALFSVGVLIIFFIMLAKRTNNLSSLLTTLLLGTSIWFMNFARSGWLNLVSVFWGISMIYSLERAIEKQKNRIFFLSGVLGGLSCYSYLSGYIFPISAIIFLTLRLISSKRKREIMNQSMLYMLGLILAFLPVAIMILLTKEDFFLRPQVVFVFGNQSPSVQLLANQAIEVLGGLLFIDENPIRRGIENLRYFPINTPVVDFFIKFLFISGIGYYVYKFCKKPFLSIWPIIYILTLGTVGILTVNPPNLARTILALPCIYFLSGIMLFKLINFSKKIISFRLTLLIVIPTILLVSYINVTGFFKWGQSEAVAYYRQPAIGYKEFPAWQDYQINLIKNGKRPLVNQEWYQIRSSILIDN